MSEETHLGYLRRMIEEQYAARGGTGCGASFGELLCHELHTRERTFIALADHWGISLPTLGELIWDHCKRLEPLPVVKEVTRYDEP